MARRSLDTSLDSLVLQGPLIVGAAPTTPQRNVLYTDSFVKGWVETSGAGAWTIDDSLNVSSITDNAVGDFTINWATAFATANYPVLCGHASANTTHLDAQETTSTAKSASVVRIVLFQGNGAGALDDPGTGISVIALGDQ